MHLFTVTGQLLRKSCPSVNKLGTEGYSTAFTKQQTYMVIELSMPKGFTQPMQDHWTRYFVQRNTIAEMTRQDVSMTVRRYKLPPMHSVTIESMLQRATTYTMSNNPLLGLLDRPGQAIYYDKGEIMHSTIARLGAFIFPENIFVFSVIKRNMTTIINKERKE